jgi:hypothetical protein
MTLSASRFASLILAAALAVPAGHAAAQNLGGLDRSAGPGREAGERAERRTEDRHHRGEDQRALSDAVRRVERRTGGQVLSAERVPFDGRNVNRVKVVDSSGRVRVYMDDPQSQGRRPSEPKRDDD